MKKWLLLLLYFCCTALLKAQTFNDRSVDDKALNIPSLQTTSTTAIAEYVKQNFGTDREKLRAIYIWVASNIKYTPDSANVINLGVDPDAKVTAAFRRRRGVCENYAAIFNDICTKAGFTGFIVDGYTKQNGFVDKTGHSWCAVFVDNTWLLCDPTWDTGNGSDTKYFLVQPSEMIGSHMPFDPMWQLLNYPVSHDQFYSGNTYHNKNEPFFNYADTIAAYVNSDSLQRFRSTVLRIQKSGVRNNLVRNRLEYNKMHIEIIREDKDADQYNSSVADLNEATSVYNNFVQFRNNQFTPAISDQALRELLEGIDIKLSAAHKKLDEIARSEATFKFSTDDLRARLNTMAAKVKEQKDFVKIYLNTAAANRQSLLYKQVTSTGK